MTNDLGHKLAQSINAPTTLGAYRGGNFIPWLPGATIDAWVPCARGEVATGVPFPHAYFIQARGERGPSSGSIFCPECRVELAERRASGAMISAPPAKPKDPPLPSSPKKKAPQPDLPF